MKSYKIKLNVESCFYGLFCSLLANIFLSISPLFKLCSKRGRKSESDEATMKVMMFIMVMTTISMKMVMTPMVNSAEDNLDTISPLSTVHKVSFCQNPGDHSHFTIFCRPVCALRFLLFTLFSSLKRHGALAM